MEHARFAPSSLSRTLACPGSLQLSEQLPKPPETVYAAEGTLLHEYVRDAIYFEIEGASFPSISNLTAYWKHRNATVEHIALVQDCLDALDLYILPDAPPVKKIVQDTRVYVMGEDCHGTLDLAVETETHLHIIDFKFGAGVAVYPDNNPQLLAYLLGYLKDNCEGSTDKEMWIWIFQPRLDAYLGVRVFDDELNYFEDRLEKGIQVAKGHFPPIRPGESQCRWCPAGAVCKERMAQVQQDASLLFSAYADISDPVKRETVPVAELARILQTESQIDSALKAIREHLFNTAMSGEEVPGFKITTGRGSRKWKLGVDVEDIHKVFPDLDTQDMLEVELKSPAKMEKLLTAKQRKDLEQFYVKAEGAPTLAPVTSVKQALDVSTLTPQAQAEKLFKDFADEEELT